MRHPVVLACIMLCHISYNTPHPAGMLHLRFDVVDNQLNTTYSTTTLPKDTIP